MKQKKIYLQIMAVVMILTLNCVDLFAQTRISFARGGSSKTVTGKLGANATKDYVVRAKAGQTLRLAGNVSYEVLGDDWNYSPNRSADWSDYELNKTGDYTIRVTNGEKPASFKLTVSIRN